MLVACASPRGPQPHPKLKPLWSEYATKPDHKAIALAGKLSGARWVTGTVAGYRDAASAEAAALAECGKQRVLRRVQEQCVLYASGDEIVWRGY